jgi:hypothetical protein
MRNKSFEKYVSNFEREDTCIWKPIKIRETPKHHQTYAQIITPAGKRAKIYKGENEIFAEHFSEISSLHNNDQDHEG